MAIDAGGERRGSHRWIEAALPVEPNVRARALLKAWEAEDVTDDPAAIEARRKDWEATKVSLNDGHSSDRKLFP